MEAERPTDQNDSFWSNCQQDLDSIPAWHRMLFGLYAVQLMFWYAFNGYGEGIAPPTKSDLETSRLNKYAPTISQHMRCMWLDLLMALKSMRHLKLSHAFIVFPFVFWFICCSALSRITLPAVCRRSWNYYYDQASSKWADPRHLRDLALNVRPLLLGWMTLVPPTALLLLTGSTVNNIVTAARGKEAVDEVPGHDCLRLTQQPDPQKRSDDITFFHSSSFIMVTLAIFALGIPALISAWIYYQFGVDALLGYPSQEEGFTTVFLIIGLYITSLSWCLMSLFFRSYYSYAMSYTSSEFEIEVYPDVIKMLPIKGWFRDFALFRTEHVPHEIEWKDVVSVAYNPASLNHEIPKANSKVLNALEKFSQFQDSLTRSLYLKSDEVHIKSSDKSVVIRLADLSKEQKAQLFFSIRKFAPSVHLDAETQTALVGSAVLREPRYTEIWFDVLTSDSRHGSNGPLEAGKSLRNGSYLVREKLGSGGQGTIYKAEKNDGETVILKEFQLTPGESLEAMIESARSFETESSLLAQLSNDQIVRLLDMFYENNCVYLVLEYVEGASLRQLVSDGGPLSEELTATLSVQMCEILAYLHQQNPPIMHRDFTPDNLIMTGNGTLKLIDFSVAQSGKDVKPGECAGKHAYTPPEQFRGETCPQSDIYALGATMFYLLTGEDPVPISTSSPRSKVETVSEELNKIVESATKLSLEERYETVLWMKTELEAFLAKAKTEACVLKTGEDEPPGERIVIKEKVRRRSKKKVG